MSGLLTAAATLIGIPLCAIVVVSGVWQYPYLIVLPVGAYFMVRALYRRANARFQRDVAALAAHTEEERRWVS